MITDHAPLKWMAMNKDKNSRVTRWFLELQDFNFKVEHRPGKLMAHADALSRMYEEEMSVSRPAGRHRGGICGISRRDRAPQRHLPGERESVRGGAEQRRLGHVVEGRYFPNHLCGAFR